MLNPPDPDDPRFTSGLRLTPAFGLGLGTRHVPHDLPPIGSAEHTALMASGPIPVAAPETAPAGFEAPAAPGPDGDTDLDELPGPVGRRRGLGNGPASAGRRLSGGPLSLDGPVPVPRTDVTAGLVLPVTGPAGGPPRLSPTSGGLNLPPTAPALGGAGEPADDAPDSRTGELVRPFVRQSDVIERMGDCTDMESVPPPVSLEELQRAARSTLKTEAGSSEDVGRRSARRTAREDGARTPWDPPASGGRARTRRERRARERAVNSPKGVAARRLAKGGILAVTALGVVSTAAPQAVSGLTDTPGPLAQALLGATSASTVDNASATVSADQAAVESEQLTQAMLGAELTSAKADQAADAAVTAAEQIAEMAQAKDDAAAKRKAEAAAAAKAAAVANVIRDPQTYAKAEMLDTYGWGDSEFVCLDSLWTRESGWNYTATNSSSGAYGIPQALPGSKMATVASDWATNPVTQIKWGLNYISERYTTPCGAWAHSEAYGWY